LDNLTYAKVNIHFKLIIHPFGFVSKTSVRKNFRGLWFGNFFTNNILTRPSLYCLSNNLKKIALN